MSNAKNCIHECVCKNYTNNCGWGFNDSGNWGWQGGFECIMEKCEYDTRRELRWEGKDGER